MSDEEGELNYLKMVGSIPMPSRLEAAQKNFWISWYWPQDLGGFELNSPWWETGARVAMSMKTGKIIEETPTICAAVRAFDEEHAMTKVIASFDKKPSALEWRFCEEKPDGWSPFSDRFPRSDWMRWESATIS
jgi:hypothetical protein